MQAKKAWWFLFTFDRSVQSIVLVCQNLFNCPNHKYTKMSCLQGTEELFYPSGFLTAHKCIVFNRCKFYALKHSGEQTAYPGLIIRTKYVYKSYLQPLKTVDTCNYYLKYNLTILTTWTFWSTNLKWSIPITLSAKPKTVMAEAECMWVARWFNSMHNATVTKYTTNNAIPILNAQTGNNPMAPISFL